MAGGIRILGGMLLAALVGLAASAWAQPMLSDPGDPFELGRRAYDARNFVEARRLWAPMAEAGDHRAQFAMATLYNEGAGVVQNLERAFHWYLKSAEQGFPAAQYNVGNAYRHGYGVDQDFEEALRWWQLAADQGVDSASFNIGTLYYYGDGVEKDEAEAFRWYRLAARQGHPIARDMFGLPPGPNRGPVTDAGPAEPARPSEQPEAVARTPVPRIVDASEPAATAEPEEVPEPSHEPASAQSPSVPESAVDRGGEPMAAVPASAESALAEPQDSPGPVVSDPGPEPTPVARPTRAAPPAPAAEEMVLYSADWLLSQDPGHFTIQLTALSDEARVTRFITRHRLRGALAYFAFSREDRTLYAVVSGVYSSRQAAREAMAELPESVQSGSPWIRPLADVQQLIAEGR